MPWAKRWIGCTGTWATRRSTTPYDRFADEFPPLAVYRREVSLEDYLEGETAGVPHRQILLEEMLMLWLANANPAFAPFLELFDDADSGQGNGLSQILTSLHDFFETQPRFGPDQQNLIDMLRAPALAHPHSLSAQLEYIRERWGSLLGSYLYRLLSSLDLIAEEEKAIFLGPGPALVYEYGELEFEPERFSPDLDWMPSLVLMAKNTYVWLHQLSRKARASHHPPGPDPRRGAGRSGPLGLHRAVADRPLGAQPGLAQSQAALRQSGGRGLGLLCCTTTRSLPTWGAKRPIKNLRERAWQRGIRLASDMVPNHVGIYSRWVVEHPDWFVSLDHSPFPSYSFNGPDLSDDERVGIYLEDHYYDRSDAAVVFKRVDRWTGSEKYIYHGNDGTSMPWNDTAQLNYLNPEVREAVIQTILHVARQFPIIRFDAAMTLTKQHFQRLWFPEPGTGGAIPTRAEHGLTKAAVRCRHARRVLAGGGGPRRRRGARHPAAGRGLLADGGLFRPHAGHAPGLQQRLHEHAARRGQCQVPLGHEEHARVRPRDPQAVRQLYEQPRRGNRRGPVRQGGQVFWHLYHDGHLARPAHVRPRPDRGLCRKVRDGVPAGLLGRAARRATW